MNVNFDVENILFYNVGESCFKNLCQKGIIFERKLQEPPKYNGSDTEMYYPHYSFYRVEEKLQYNNYGNVLAEWNDIVLPDPTGEIKHYNIWYVMKKNYVRLFKINESKKFIGIKVKIQGPESCTNCGLNLAKIIKPLIDGIISVFNYCNGFNSKEIASILSEKLSESSNDLEDMIKDRTIAVLGWKDFINKGANGIQWNPSDDLIASAEITVSYNNTNNWTHSGEIFSIDGKEKHINCSAPDRIKNSDKNTNKQLFSSRKNDNNKAKLWVNIDIPLKRCTFHGCPSCIYVLKKKETDYKGIGRLKRDGGWIGFSNIETAQIYCKDFFNKGYLKKTHC